MDRFELHRLFIREHMAPAKLTPTQALVWLSMWDYANTSGEAWPAVSTIARHLGHKSPSEVKRARSELVKRGFLKIVSPGGGKKTDTAKFEVCLPVGKNPPGGKDTPGGNLFEPGGKNPPSTGREIPTEPGGKNPPQTEQITDQENKPQKGEPAPAWIGLLRDDLRASGEFVAVLSDWLAEKPQTQARQKANLKRIENLSVADAIGCVNYSLAGNHPALYPDWNKKHEPKRNSARRDGCFPEPPTNVRIFVGPGAQQR